MVRKFIVTLSLCLVLGIMLGQKTDTAKANAGVANSEIIEELRAIRKLQEDERNKRQKAFQEYNKRSGRPKVNDADTSADIGVMTQIESNTRPSWLKDGWDSYGWIAFLVALISVYYAIKTYKEQKKTESNTKNVSREAQRHLLNELLRHLYRNFVITYTMTTKMKDIGYAGYPSEEHFTKLKIPMENIHLESFYGDDEKFRELHVLYLNLRNYNEEIEVAMHHIVNPRLTQEVKDEDFGTLLFKVSFLTGKIVEAIQKVWGNDEGYKKDMREAIEKSTSGATNAKNNIDVPGSGDFERFPLEKFKKLSYNRIYSDEGLERMCEIFNNDVHEERKRNASGSWKVRMIKY